MSLHRFFIGDLLSDDASTSIELALSDADRHHLSRVVRLVPGDRVVVVDSDGAEAEATLTEVTQERVLADVGPKLVRPKRPRVVLAPAIARRERMELTVQKTTELGVAEIWPVVTSRCVVRLDEERSGKRAQRWRRIAEEAAKQSQRSDVPVVREPMTLTQLASEAGAFDVVLVPWEEAAAGGLGIGAALDAAGALPDTSVLLVIGPEGGLSDVEVSTLEAAGGVVVTLGDTVLRTETAAVVAVALAEYELGSLGGRGR